MHRRRRRRRRQVSACRAAASCEPSTFHGSEIWSVPLTWTCEVDEEHFHRLHQVIKAQEVKKSSKWFTNLSLCVKRSQKSISYEKAALLYEDAVNPDIDLKLLSAREGPSRQQAFRLGYLRMCSEQSGQRFIHMMRTDQMLWGSARRCRTKEAFRKPNFSLKINFIYHAH